MPNQDQDPDPESMNPDTKHWFLDAFVQPGMRMIPKLCAVRPCLILCLNETHALGSHFHQDRPGTGGGQVRVPALFSWGFPPYSCQGSRPILVSVPALFLSAFPPYSCQGSRPILVRVPALFLSGFPPYYCQGSRPILIRVHVLILSGFPPYSCQGSRPILVRARPILVRFHALFLSESRPILVRVRVFFLIFLIFSTLQRYYRKFEERKEE